MIVRRRPQFLDGFVEVERSEKLEEICRGQQVVAVVCERRASVIVEDDVGVGRMDEADVNTTGKLPSNEANLRCGDGTLGCQIHD